MSYSVGFLEKTSAPYFQNPYIPNVQTELCLDAYQELPATQSTSRAGWRRMCTETPTTICDPTTACDPGFVIPDDPFDALQPLLLQIDEVLREGRYEKAFSLINQMDVLWNTTLLDQITKLVASSDRQLQSPRLRDALAYMGQGSLSIMRAYFLALTDDVSAIDLCNAGFAQLRRSLLEFETILMRMLSGEIITDEDFEKNLELFNIGQYLIRGAFALSLNMREVAIDDLTTGCSLLSGSKSSDLENVDVYLLFLIKILEQKLQTSLIPQSSIVNPTSFRSLFLAGRYEEALALCSTTQAFENEFDTEDYQAVLLALLGRHNEALDLLKKMEDDFERPGLGVSLVYLLQKDFEKAKETALRDPAFYLLLPVIVGCERISMTEIGS